MRSEGARIPYEEMVSLCHTCIHLRQRLLWACLALGQVVSLRVIPGWWDIREQAGCLDTGSQAVVRRHSTGNARNHLLFFIRIRNQASDSGMEC